MLKAIRRGDWGEAEEIRGIFRTLEELRRKQSPVSVLQEAHRFAEMGPIPCILTPVNECYLSRVREAAQTLLAGERHRNESFHEPDLSKPECPNRRNPPR